MSSPDGEVGDHVAGGGGLAHLGDHVEIEIVETGAAGHDVPVAAADEHVVTSTATQRIDP